MRFYVLVTCYRPLFVYLYCSRFGLLSTTGLYTKLTRSKTTWCIRLTMASIGEQKLRRETGWRMGPSQFEALLSPNAQRKGQRLFHQRKDHKAPVQKTQTKNTALNFTVSLTFSMTNLNHGLSKSARVLWLLIFPLTMKGIAQLDNTVEVLDFKKILRIDLIVGFEIIGRGNPINTDVKASSFSATKENISSRKLRSKQPHGRTNNLTMSLRKMR